MIDGGPGDDQLVGGGGRDTLDGGQGSDGCNGAKGRTVSCGKERPPKGSAYVAARPAAPAAAPACRSSAAPAATTSSSPSTKRPSTFGVTRRRSRWRSAPAACTRRGVANQVSCPADGPGRWLMADLGPGNDKLRVEGSLLAVGSVRLAGGLGNDAIHGGPEDDLIEAGPGADKLYGGDGADGLVGGLPGPTFLYGEGNGDLLAAGGGCAGGALVGGPGRDDASFAETQAHPGLLIISFPSTRRLDRRGQGLRQRPPLAAPTRTWRAPSTGTS